MYCTRPLYQAQETQQLHLGATQVGAKMRRQRNMSQIKEEEKTPEKKLHKMETSNLPEAEFKTLVIRMLSELRTSMA